MRAVNGQRKKIRLARNFGEEAAAVRAMKCCIEGRGLHVCRYDAALFEDAWIKQSHPAHNPSTGAGGGRFDLAPMCADAHDEQHRRGVKGFEKTYSIDLRKLADEIAVSHLRPLGIRGVADRFEEITLHDPRHAMSDYELGALTGWVRRRIQRMATADREDIAHTVMLELGLDDDPAGPHGRAWTLCEAAGWGS